jgi:AsnC-type helix-turn-helix domain
VEGRSGRRPARRPCGADLREPSRAPPVRPRRCRSVRACRSLLAALQQDARGGYAELGRIVRLSASAVTERERKLEEARVITGYATELDAELLGLTIMALVRLRYPSGNYKPFHDLLVPRCSGWLGNRPAMRRPRPVKPRRSGGRTGRDHHRRRRAPPHPQLRLPPPPDPVLRILASPHRQSMMIVRRPPNRRARCPGPAVFPSGPPRTPRPLPSPGRRAAGVGLGWPTDSGRRAVGFRTTCRGTGGISTQRRQACPARSCTHDPRP